MRWRRPGRSSGPRSVTALLVTLGLGLVWVGWPVWSSSDAPVREDLRAELTSLLAATACLLVLLAWAIWRDADRQVDVLAPIMLAAGAAAVARWVLLPRTNSLEPVFAVPLVVGAALGGPAGFLTGSLACLASSAALGLVAEPLPGQALVWGLWGAAGGLFHGRGRVAAWLGASVACVPMGIVSGVLLNVLGWTGETTAAVGAFLPGAGPAESFTRLWRYSVATSLAPDIVRGVTSAVAVAVIGLPLLGGLRAATGNEPPTLQRPPAGQRVAPSALARRERSARLTELWTPTRGEPR